MGNLLFNIYTVFHLRKKFGKYTVVMVVKCCECNECHCIVDFKMVKIANFILNILQF